MHVAWCGCVDIVDIQVTKLLLLLLLLVLWPDLMPACLPVLVCLFVSVRPYVGERWSVNGRLSFHMRRRNPDIFRCVCVCVCVCVCLS